VLKEERVLRLLLAVALASAVLVPLTSVDAARSPTSGKSHKDKAPATTSKSRHGQAKTASTAKPTTKKTQDQTAKPTTKKSQDQTAKPTTKKTQDQTATPNRGTIDPIGTVSRGQTIEVHATALRNGQMCALQVFYDDKPAKTVRDIEPDDKKRCTFSVTVPDRPGVVGVAKAKLILTSATSGKHAGEARQTFNVQ
jgi:hypothetical protein